MGRFPDDEWREILEANGFLPSGAREEVWRNVNVSVKIDVNRETQEPYYQVGATQGTDSEELKNLITKEPEPPAPEEVKRKDDEFLKSMGIIATVHIEKKAGRPPRFTFSVPLKAAGNVAFHLAKAGMKDFDVSHYEEDNLSMFTFPSEPEMHVAEEIVKAEFADQIRSRKGYWGMWSEKGEDPSQIKSEKDLEPKHQYVAGWMAREQGKVAGQWGERSWDSDQVHDILDKYRNEDTRNLSFDNPVPQDKLPALLKELDSLSGDEDTYVGVIVFLITHGSNVPGTYRARARQIAFAEVQNEAYLQEWASPDDRRVELENEIELLEGTPKQAADLNDRYRRKKLDAWIAELGIDYDAELAAYDAGDFWTKDKIYEEVRDMIKEERKFQSHYRRQKVGPIPRANRNPQ